MESPSVPALDLLLDHGAPVDGHLVLVEGADGLPHEVAQLALALQEAGAPNVGLEGGLVHAGLPVLVYDLGEVYFLGGGVFIEPLDAIHRDISFVLLRQLVLHSRLAHELLLYEGLVLDVPLQLLGGRCLLLYRLYRRLEDQLLRQEGRFWLDFACRFGQLREEVGSNVAFLLLDGFLLLLLDLGYLLRLPVLEVGIVLAGLGLEVLEWKLFDDFFGLRLFLRLLFLCLLLSHLQQIISDSNIQVIPSLPLCYSQKQAIDHSPRSLLPLSSAVCPTILPLELSNPENSIPRPLYIQMSSSTELKTLHQALTGQLLPKSSELHNHVRQFLQEEIKDFEAVNSKNDQVLDELRQEWDFCNKKTSDVKAKKSKDSKFIEGGAGYLKAKDDEMKAKQKVLESINTGLKESVTKVNPKKLAKLPYNTEPILKEVFSTFYHILYNEPAQSFDWEVFVKLALLHEQGEDFITRLANINFKDLQPAHYDALRVLKTDLKFIDVCENSPFAIDIVDLADWIDYVVEGHKVFLEKQACEHDYQKIRKDISKRSDGTTQMSEEFYNDTLRDVDAYQTNLMNLQSELRTLIIGMGQNLKGLTEIEERRAEKIHAINSM